MCLILINALTFILNLSSTKVTEACIGQMKLKTVNEQVFSLNSYTSEQSRSSSMAFKGPQSPEVNGSSYIFEMQHNRPSPTHSNAPNLSKPPPHSIHSILFFDGFAPEFENPSRGSRDLKSKQDHHQSIKGTDILRFG